MDKTLLECMGGIAYNLFLNSSTSLSVFNKETKQFYMINNSMKQRMGEINNYDVKLIAQTKEETYITMNKVPCKLRVVTEISDELSLVEMFPAHTRKWDETSDLVYLTDMTSDGVWEWYPELEFEYMSERFWSVLGYDQNEMEENPQVWMDVIHKDDLENVIETRESHISSKGSVPCISKARYICQDKKELILLCRAYIIEWLPDGRPWRLLGTYTDITDIVKKDALEAKSIFISRMSHEIRSPLCTILNECEILNDKINTKIIAETCAHLVSITDDILSLGKINHAPMKLCTEKRDMVEVISACTKRHRLEAKKAGVKIQVVMGDLPDLVSVDPSKFNQVLDNLMTNAIKYSYENTKISIIPEYDYEREMCYIRIEDSGIGMSNNLKSKAFDEFVQGDDTVQGAGIGLSLARRIARFMGGDVVIEKSELENGTTMLFTSILPLDKTSMGNMKKMTVLIVDDMGTNRVILKRRLQCLRDMGMVITDVLEATDGKEALDIFKEYVGKIDLVLMDCHMPIMNGFEATKEIHKYCTDEVKIPPVPIIAVTASVSNELHDKCLTTGMVGVVIKPYSENDLLFSIISCMNDSK